MNDCKCHLDWYEATAHSIPLLSQSLSCPRYPNRRNDKIQEWKALGVRHHRIAQSNLAVYHWFVKKDFFHDAFQLFQIFLMDRDNWAMISELAISSNENDKVCVCVFGWVSVWVRGNGKCDMNVWLINWRCVFVGFDGLDWLMNIILHVEMECEKLVKYVQNLLVASFFPTQSLAQLRSIKIVIL